MSGMNKKKKKNFFGKEYEYMPWIEEHKAFLSDKEFIKIMLNTKKEE